MRTTYLDLVMSDGNLVRIECPTKREDDLHESLEMAMKCKDWWSPNRFDGCVASYLGHRLDRVNMSLVVGLMA